MARFLPDSRSQTPDSESSKDSESLNQESLNYKLTYEAKFQEGLTHVVPQGTKCVIRLL